MYEGKILEYWIKVASTSNWEIIFKKNIEGNNFL